MWVPPTSRSGSELPLQLVRMAWDLLEEAGKAAPLRSQSCGPCTKQRGPQVATHTFDASTARPQDSVGLGASNSVVDDFYSSRQPAKILCAL